MGIGVCFVKVNIAQPGPGAEFNDTCLARHIGGQLAANLPVTPVNLRAGLL